MCGLQNSCRTEGAGSASIEETVLLDTVCGSGAEAPRHGCSAVWTVLEEPASRSAAARQGVSVLREDTGGQWSGVACPSLEAVPIRGTNHPSNLIALCESCHYKIESITEQVLASIQIEVTLVGSSLTINLEGVQRWPVS